MAVLDQQGRRFRGYIYKLLRESLATVPTPSQGPYGYYYYYNQKIIVSIWTSTGCRYCG